MERLKKERTPVRAAFTRTVNEIEVELSRGDVDHRNLRLKGDKIHRLSEELRELDQRILTHMLDDDCDDDVYEAEREGIDKYIDAKMAVDFDIRKCLQEDALVVAVNQDSSSVSDETKKKYKLPKIELYKFDGELCNWLHFWSQFQRIHRDDDLHDCDKFHYLLQSMAPGSARDMVESYPLTDENYPRAIDALKERFGKKDLLVEFYVRELHKIALENFSINERPSLSCLYDKLQCRLMALESLGVASDSYAAMLYPIVESSLSEEVLRTWQRSPDSSLSGEAATEHLQPSRLQQLMQFLKKEVEAEDRITLAKSGYSSSASGRRTSQGREMKAKLNKGALPTAAGLFIGQVNTCVFCDKSHASSECMKAVNMSLQEKKEKLKAKRVCYNCLKAGHQAKFCKTFLKCMVCFRKHLTLMCPEAPGNRREKLIEKEAVHRQAESQQPESINSVTSALNCTNEVLLQTLEVWTTTAAGKRKKVRALLDPGSQRSYILKSTAEELGLQSRGEAELQHLLFGGRQELVKHHKYTISLTNDGKDVVIEVLDQQQICGTIPRMTKGQWLRELSTKKIWIADIGKGRPEIEVLIGADYYGNLLTGKRHELQNGLIALETLLGWTLLGRRSGTTNEVVSMLVVESKVSDLWNLETIGITDPIETKSTMERDAETKARFMELIDRNPDQRYCVRLPWTVDEKILPNNRETALQRLRTTTKKLKASGHFGLYDELFKLWKSEGIIEELEESTINDNMGHYLPHRAVHKPESLTTPIRPVFDASCKSKCGPSLNDCLEKGPNLLALIPTIILRFREKRIGFTSDIRKAFQMMEVMERDRDFLRFLWWEDSSEERLKVFRHRRVVFGVNCSPFLLAAVIELHLQNVDDEDSVVANDLLRSLYVDNCVFSLDTLKEYEEFKATAIRIMADAKMDLRQWESSGKNMTTDSDRFDNHMTSVLGLKWNKNTDTLLCNIVDHNEIVHVTKRTVLSMMNRIFDPIGFTLPVTLGIKHLIQELWQKKVSWDEELSEPFVTKVKSWYNDIRHLTEVVIPRHSTNGLSQNASRQLHCFFDASRNAYAAVVYLRVEENGQVSVQLLLAKTRIAPINRPTIPRMELMGAIIAARLAHSVKEAFGNQDLPTFFWTDSSTVLAWIRRNDSWGTFVGNRVKEICNLTDTDEWHFVPGQMNPADLPSRGCSSKALLDSRWWEGPRWLYGPEKEWPSESSAPDEEMVSMELKKTSIATMVELSQDSDTWYVRRFSSYSANVRLFAWMCRFVDKCRKRSFQKGELTADEINYAERRVIKMVQQESFLRGCDTVNGIQVMRDEDGLVKVRTRLSNRVDLASFKMPLLLPSKHPLVDQLIIEEHKKSGHGGVQLLMSRLRERVWILQSRRTIRRVLRTCHRCLRFSAKSCEAQYGPLPADRVKTAQAFEVTGVDLAGPLYLRTGAKVWIVLYTCAIFRGVWFDYVISLSTEAFLDSLQRFICACGRPSKIYSDNATNFTGASRLLRNASWTKIQQKCSVERIEWRFNPPTAAWWGGWWERLIRTTKDLLKRMLGNARVNENQLRTCLATIQATINDRPLTSMTEDQEDLRPLTPSMFMRGVASADCPEYFEIATGDVQKSYQYHKTLQHELRTRFRSEYLSQLVQRANRKRLRDIKVGDIVLVGSDNKKRLEWPMARVMELLPGKDGNVRLVRVKTASGIFLRPVQRLYPMEVSSTDVLQEEKGRLRPSGNRPENQSLKSSDVVTSRGRLVRKPDRFS